MKPVIKWYKAIKAEAQCVTCQHYDLSEKPDQIEFHHIDAETKADCLSNIAFRHRIVYRQEPAAVTFLLETFKCAPLCRIHHAQLHEAERVGNTPLLKDRFDLAGDDGYRKLTGQFWQMSICKTPPELASEVNNTILDMLEDGRIIFGQQGFALASPPPRAAQVTVCRY